MPDEEAEFTFHIWDTWVRAAQRPSGGLTDGRVGNVLCRISFLELDSGYGRDLLGCRVKAVPFCMSFLGL